jgi:lincosamide nucleotidyltransferase A/C/D/E
MAETTIADVHALLDLLDANGIEIWLDGGWAVDALLGEQTRAHNDLDIVIAFADVPTLWVLLKERGYNDVPRDDTSPWNFVMGNTQGVEIDFHVVTFDAQGTGVYGPQRDDFSYTAAALQGQGVIGGRSVRCITPDVLVYFHTLYTPDANDVHDVVALCRRFGIRYPASFPSLHAPG